MNLKLPYSSTTSELALDMMRVFLGIALIGKGVFFIQNMNRLFEMTSSAISYGDFVLAHYIIFAHIIGGGCIAAGLLTRQAALANIPILLGAVTLVHLQEGLFTPGQGLEVSMMVFFLLCLTMYHGSGRYSMDYYINKSYREQIHQMPEHAENIIDLQAHRDKIEESAKTDDDIDKVA